VLRHYRRGVEEVHALRAVSLALYPGDLTLVLGPSGGGKSTLLHLVLALNSEHALRDTIHEALLDPRHERPLARLLLHSPGA